MPREISATMQTALESSGIRPRFIYEGNFSALTLRLWSGDYDLSWDSKTWLGNGYFTGLSAVSESSGIRANSVVVTLSGIPTTLVSLILSGAQSGAVGNIWLALINDAGAVIADPIQIFSGLTDVPTINDSGRTATITISYESDLVDLNRQRETRLTHEMQQVDYSGDEGFIYVEGLQDKTCFWGVSKDAGAL